MKKALTVLLLFFNLFGRAQGVFVESVVLESTENQFLQSFNTHELSSALLTAFKEGRIDGYSKGPEVVPILGKEKTDLGYPEFESDKQYFAADIVKFGDKYYTATFDTSFSPDQQPTHWTIYERFEELGKKIYYPGETARISYDDWRAKSIVGLTYGGYYQDGVEYFSGDVIFHEGQCYFALRDTKEKMPTKNNKSWKQCDCNVYVEPSMIDRIEVRHASADAKDEHTYVGLSHANRYFVYFRLNEIKNYLNTK